jgi:hypothetical protein
MLYKNTDASARIRSGHRREIGAFNKLLTRSQSLAWSTMVLIAAAAVCSAQAVTSAHSGTLNYLEGTVSVDGSLIQSNVGRFSELKEQSVLRTGQGRAELLLTPGVVLRVGENSAVKMLDSRLVSTRVEVLSGSVIAESEDPQVSLRDSPVALIYKGFSIQIVKYGLVEISSDPAQVKVYGGEAAVDIANAGTANNRATVRKAQLLPLSAALLSEKFNDKAVDALYLWARNRARSVSAANAALERSVGLNERGYEYRPGPYGWSITSTHE